MSDAIEVYLLYPKSVSKQDKFEIFEQLYSRGDLRCDTSLGEIENRLCGDKALNYVNLIYGDLHASIQFDRSVESLPDESLMLLHLEEKSFRTRHYSEDEIAGHIDDLLALVTAIYEMSLSHDLPPAYVIGANTTETEHLRTGHERIRTTESGVREAEIEELYWLQIWPPEFVRSIGKQSILEAPAWKVEELSDGAIVLVAYENPLFLSEDYLDLLDHLSLSR